MTSATRAPDVDVLVFEVSAGTLAQYASEGITAPGFYFYATFEPQGPYATREAAKAACARYHRAADEFGER